MAKLIMQEEASNIATPGAGKWGLFYKAGGLYVIDDTGAVFGPINIPSSTTQNGLVELATAAEALAGTDMARAVTPAGLFLPPGFLYGLTISNNTGDATNDIDIAAGKCRDSTDAANMILASAITKRLDATWAVGTNQGGLDTGAIANTTYHVWLIKRSDTGVVDVLFSASATAPTMPANYDFKRRIGSIVRVSGAILPFRQDGDDFYLSVPVQDYAATNPGTAAVTVPLASVPAGIRVKAIVTVYGQGTISTDNPGAVMVSDLARTDTAPAHNTVHNAIQYNGGAVVNRDSQTLHVYTDTSTQIRWRCQVSTAATIVRVITHGWIDTRGRLV